MSTGALPLTVGFIGAGKIGLPMAEHLLRAGYAVIVYDTLPANALQARVFGCMVSETLGGCASQADVLFSSMPNDAALESITGAEGVFAHAKPGMIYVDTSTVSGNQMIKDLDLILGQGAATHTPLPLTALMRQHYDAIAAQGEGELDYIATVRLMERMAGLSS